jgi:hypothetical protein
MIILGGREEDVSLNLSSIGGLPVDIYDTDRHDWISNLNFDKFRHASFSVDKYAFIHGGCAYSDPTATTDNVSMFDILELCSTMKK